MTLTLPPYVELPGSSTYQHPYPMQGMNLQMFILHADYQQLVRTTDNYLNRVPGSPYRYSPLLPFVFCQTVWIDRILWQPPGQGWMREADFNFGYYVACHRDGKFDHIAVVQSYLMVDNPLTVSSGREVFGYRKAFSQMEYVAGTYQPAAASTWVLKKYAPDEELQLAEIARINAPPGWPAATRHAKFEDLLGLAELAVGDFVMDVGVAIRHLTDHFKSQMINVAYLLELRDVQYPQSAGYMALIESPMQIMRHNSAWFLPKGFTIQLTDYASYPIVSDLGIKVDGNMVAESVMSYQANWDVLLQPGTVLAVAGRTTPS